MANFYLLRGASIAKVFGAAGAAIFGYKIAYPYV
jgi:hypothetical protein